MIRSWWRNPILISLIVVLAYGVTLCGAIIPLTGDQKVYLSIALEMLQRGNWVVPTLFGDPNFLKPPLQYWATLMGWKLFGISLFGAFIPSVLALAGSAFFTIKIARKLDLQRPSLAGLLTAATIGSMTYGTTAQMEIWIVFFLLSSWYAVLNGRIFLAYLLVGLMAWVKGPLYPALFTFSILYWSPKLLLRPVFWISLSIGALVGLGWYGAVSITHYQELMRQFFEVENVGKISTTQGSPLGLWSEFLFTLFPWCGLILVGAFQSITRSRWKSQIRFYLGYSLLSALFFTFFPYRVNTYLYFMTPIMAMMVSEIDFDWGRKLKSALLSFYGLVFLAMLVVIHQLVSGDWLGWGIELGWILVCALFLKSLFTPNDRLIGLSSLAIVVLIRLMAVQIGTLDFKDLKTFDQKHQFPLAYFHEQKGIWHEYGFASATLGKPVTVLTDVESLNRFLDGGGAIILEEDQLYPELSGLHCADWQRLKRRIRFPFLKLLKEGVRWGDPEIMRTFRICFQSR
jgi:4-amino-4-deoxy-L-arabinose transferase-like glycosyltransferase